MAAVDAGAHNNALMPSDELDDLFDYNVPADIFQDVDIDLEVPVRSTERITGDGGQTGHRSLGIDEEIKVTKKRISIAKLDEDRLLSSAGIPRLRHITRKGFKFRGKGHEFSDVARLLNVYQLWLDDLYPRAKFTDGLEMIEKLGHKNRLLVMRKEWINESKHKSKSEHSEIASEVSERQQTKSNLPYPELEAISVKEIQTPGSNGCADSNIVEHQNSSDAITKRNPPETSISSLFVSNNDASDECPSEDDLNALLAEEEVKEKTNPIAPQSQVNSYRRRDVDFEDEMEAMAGLDDMW